MAIFCYCSMAAPAVKDLPSSHFDVWAAFTFSVNSSSISLSLKMQMLIASFAAAREPERRQGGGDI